MLIKLPIVWIVVLNVIGWIVIQVGLAWAFTMMPIRWFNPAKAFRFESDGQFYERVFGIKKWKDKLPDAAQWFRGGFPKANLSSADVEYLCRFIRETWRGELCHWVAMACTPLFFLWNPWWGNLLIVAYSVMANFPCVLAQRYNRARLRRLLERKKANTARRSKSAPL